MDEAAKKLNNIDADGGAQAQEQPQAHAQESIKNIEKSKEFTLKKFICIDTLKKRNESKLRENENSETNKFEHDENEFCINCTCKMCIEYREIIIQLIYDYRRARNIWNMLRTTVKKCYEPMLKKIKSEKILEVCNKMIDEEKFGWLITGPLTDKKIQHIEFISDLPLTDNMKLVILSALLSSDDPHQLFALLTFQAECFIKAYSEYLEEIMSANKLLTVDIILYVLNGYEEMNKTAQLMSNLLFTFENHLEQFSLSWTLINKKLYEKWIYSKLTDILSVCIQKLKKEVDTERFAILVRQYVNFDDNMRLIDEQWCDKSDALDKYYLSGKEIERKKKLKTICDMFNTIKNDKTISLSLNQKYIDISHWKKHTDRDLIWTNMIYFIKRKWSRCNEFFYSKFIDNYPSRDPSKSSNQNKPKEQKPLNNEELAIEKILDYKTTFKPKIRLSYAISSLIKKKMNTTYHISWAVFKHLKDRKPYPHSTIEEKYFCSNCNQTSCLLAKKILNNEMAFNLSKYLVNHYQPFNITHKEMAEMLPTLMLYHRKVVSVNIFVYDPPDDDVIIESFWTFIISAFISYVVNTERSTPITTTTTTTATTITTTTEYNVLDKINLEHLRLIDNDIELSKEHMEPDDKAIKFWDFIEKIKCLLKANAQNHSAKIYELRKEEELRLSMEKNHHHAESAKISKRIVEPNVTRNRLQCCSDHHQGEFESCRENHFTKMCFNEKECSHMRVNETRDRLRKKLSQLANAKKSKLMNEMPSTSSSSSSPPSSSSGNVKNDSKAGLKGGIDANLLATVIRSTNRTIITNENIEKINDSSNKSKQNCVPSSSQKQNENLIKNNDDGSTVKMEKQMKPISNETVTNPSTVKSRDLNEWIKDTLNFIEGTTEVKKVSQTSDSKKAAKKAKQKLKKEETKRIEELQDLRSQFYDLYFKEFVSKTELKNQKNLKRKDKKRITELEANIKKMNKAKTKIETSILELISLVKSSNSNFKFPYLPTKEQQQQMLLKAFPEKTQENSSNDVNSTSNQQAIKTNTAQFDMSSTSLPSTGFLSQSHLPVGIQQMPHGLQPNQQQQQQQHSRVYCPPDDVSDSTKRIVTIRRVTLPHVSEPQVTVTAKGESPDKDKLLYTFINGQLVPATSLDSKILNVLQPNTSPPQFAKETQNIQPSLQQTANKRATNSELNTAKQKSNVALNNINSQNKKGKSSKGKMNTINSNNNSSNLAKQPIINDNSNKVISSTEKNSSGNVQNQNLETKTKNNKKNQKNKTNDVKSDDVIIEKNPSVNSNCKEKQKSTIPQQVQPQVQQKIKNVNSSKNQKMNETNPKLSNKVVDNGQFDNNQFKMLHLDEFLTDTSNANTRKKNKKEKNQQNKTAAKKINDQQNNSNSFKKSSADNTINNNRNQNQNTVTTTTTTTKRQSIPQQQQQQQQRQNSSTTKDIRINHGSSNQYQLQQQQQQQQQQQSNKLLKNDKSKTNEKIENATKSLHRSLRKLNLNSDMTIELTKNVTEPINCVSNMNISIMEQLNRGVQVEDLTLPPGITLTKVDPIRAEAIRAKTESIDKLSQPMQSQSQSNQYPNISSPVNSLSHFGKYSTDKSGVIMVDAMNLKKSLPAAAANNKTLPQTEENKNKSKRVKRKNKKKKNDANNTPNAENKTHVNGNMNDPKIVTLRNPIFHGETMTTDSAFPLQNKMSLAAIAASAPTIDQPAAIIKNENGMFTIRNPALHQAFLNGFQKNFNQYNPGYHTSKPNTEHMNNDYFYFSENSTQNCGILDNSNPKNRTLSSSSISSSSNRGKHISAIGSEIKNAQQKKLNSQWQHQQQQQQQLPCLNHYKSCEYPVAGQQLNQCTDIHQQNNFHHQSNYFNGYNIMQPNYIDSCNSRSLFNNLQHHSCGDDSPPPSVKEFNRYLDGLSDNNGKFVGGNMPFSRNFMPGQRLNNEVTIHNIDESKFNGNNSTNSPITHRVEITPVSYLSSSSRSSNLSNNTDNHSLTNDSPLGTTTTGTGKTSASALSSVKSELPLPDDTYFLNHHHHHHRLSLNDDLMNNDISSVKHFNNYGFDSTSSSSSSPNCNNNNNNNNNNNISINNNNNNLINNDITNENNFLISSYYNIDNNNSNATIKTSPTSSSSSTTTTKTPISVEQQQNNYNNICCNNNSSNNSNRSSSSTSSTSNTIAATYLNNNESMDNFIQNMNNLKVSTTSSTSPSLSSSGGNNSNNNSCIQINESTWW